MNEPRTLTMDWIRDEPRGDLYAFYDELREEAPIYRVSRPSGLETWLVTRYDDALAVLNDTRFGKQPDRIEQAFRDAGFPVSDEDNGSPLRRTMLTTDPPDHTRLRGLVNRAFTPRRINALRPRIEEITNGLLDAMAPTGETDLITAFAFPLPITVITELLGIPASDRDQFRVWVDEMLDTPPEERLKADRPLNGYLRDLVARRREQIDWSLPGDAQPDLVSSLIVARDREDRLDEEELISMIALLLVAGYITTVNLIGNGMLALFRRPDQMRLLQERPELITSAVEEFLRFDGPVTQILGRVPTEDVVLDGVRIPEGSIVTVVLASADHDPRRFDNPDTLDITRSRNDHLAFGHGIHFCLGAPLARLEGQIAIGSLVKRFPDISLAVPVEELRYRRPAGFLRALDRLPVRFTPTATERMVPDVALAR